MKTVYVIEGSSFYIEDLCHWIVGAFQSKEQAEDYLNHIEGWVKLNQKVLKKDLGKKLKNPFDSKMEYCYCTPDYEILEVALIEDFEWRCEK